MLPNLPTLKSQCQMILNRRIAATARERLGAFRDIGMHVVHEGSKMLTLRADGTSDVSDMTTTSAEISIDLRKTGLLSVDDRLAMLDDMANQMATKMQSSFYGVLDSMLEEKGQVVDAKGGSPVDAIFQTLEKIQLDFDDEGNQKPLTLAADPATQEKLARAEEEIKRNPELRERYEALINQQRENWRAREAARELVG